MTTTQQGSRPGKSEDAGIRVNQVNWRRHSRRLDLNSDRDVALAMGVDRTTVWRVRTGLASPNGRFIARALLLMRAASFDELFEPWIEE